MAADFKTTRGFRTGLPTPRLPSAAPRQKQTETRRKRKRRAWAAASALLHGQCCREEEEYRGRTAGTGAAREAKSGLDSCLSIGRSGEGGEGREEEELYGRICRAARVRGRGAGGSRGGQRRRRIDCFYGGDSIYRSTERGRSAWGERRRVLNPTGWPTCRSTRSKEREQLVPPPSSKKKKKKKKRQKKN